MKKIYNLIFLTVLLLCSSCNREEWLDIKPKGLIIPTTVQDYRLILDQVDQNGEGWPKISPGFGEGYSNPEFMSDDVVISEETRDIFGQSTFKFYTWDDNAFQANEEDGDWANLYGQIYPANIIIEEIMDAEKGSTEEKSQLLAEAKLHRAFNYFALVNMYALHYNPNTASTNLAVPLRLDSKIEGADLSRVTVQRIYDLMLEDVTSSITNLPDVPESNTHKHRPSKVSAYAFLARLYLYMGQYNDALDAANESLKIYAVLNDFNNHSINPWGLNLIHLDEQDLDPQVLWTKGATSGYGGLTLSDELLNLYEANDLRQFLSAPIADLFGDATLTGYYTGFQWTTGGYKALGFTVPEVLLTRAECNVRLNNLSLAIEDLNTLRIKRFTTGTYTPLANTNQAEVLNLVKTERRIELFANGLRFFDLKRYNEFDNADISLTRNIDGKTYNLNAGSNNWALPIAKKYILASPEIGENVRD